MNERPFIPAAATIEELEQKAADCDRRAVKQEGASAEALHQKARLYRESVAQLRCGRWTS